MTASSLRRAAVLLTALVATALAHAGLPAPRPLFKLWPYEARRTADGQVQMAYDLTALKDGILDLEAAAELDEPSLKALARALPRDVKVVVDHSQASLRLDVGGDREKAAPAPSFAAVSDAPLAYTPLDERPGARLVPALHPDSAKLWLSLDALLWKARHANESIVAGVELAAEEGTLGLPMGSRAFWQAVLKAAVDRAGQSDGALKEGALLLGAQVAAALRLQDIGAPMALARHDSAVAAIDERLSAFEEDKLAVASSLRSTFTPDLRRLQLRDRLLALPLPDSRPGKAAGLTFLVVLERDKKLAGAYEALRKLRDGWRGAPEKDALDDWRKLAAELGGAQAAIDDFPEFVSRLQRRSMPMPALFASRDAPIERQLVELGGQGLENARDEVVLALSEGRLQPSMEETASWASVFDGAISAVLVPSAKGDRPPRAVTRPYRDRLTHAFLATLPAPSLEVEAHPADPSSAADRRPYGLKVALMVPPAFELEPHPLLMGRLATAFARLERLLAATGKAGNAVGVLPGGGKRPQNNKAEAQKLRRLFRGLELILGGSSPPSKDDAEATKLAQQFLKAWKTDTDLSQDVRFVTALRGGGQLAVYGVGRQPLTVDWEGRPLVRVEGEGKDHFVVELEAQRYLSSMLVVGEPSYPGTLPDRATFRAISDRVQRDPAAVDASLAPGP